MIMLDCSYMYDFSTQKSECVEAAEIKDWGKYIPQSRPAQELYKLYQLEGMSPRDAAIRVLADVLHAREVKSQP